MLFWTWGVGPDPVIDFGRELYVPWQITLRKALYTDVASFNGPLSAYLNAFWFQLFGVSVRSLIIANFGLMMILLCFMDRLMTLMAGRFAAAVTGVLFVGLFGFGQVADVPNYSYLTPYSHELTHGLVLSVAAIYAMARYIESANRLALLATGVALGLAFLTKAEVFLAVAPAVSMGLISAFRHQRIQVPEGLRRTALVVTGLMVPVMAAFVALQTAMPWRVAALGLLGSWKYVFNDRLTGLVFYRHMLGLDDLAHRVQVIAASGALSILLFGTAMAVAFAVRRTKETIRVAIVTAIALAAVSFVVHKVFSLGEMARPLGLLVVILGVWQLFDKALQSSEKRSAHVLGLVWTIFSLLLLAKIGLNTQVYRYGFVLAMPATVLLVAALVSWIPGWIDSRGGSGVFFRGVASMGLAGILTLQIWLMGQSLPRYRVAVGEGADQFLADAKGVPVQAALAAIAARTPTDATLVVLPEGVMLNYLSRRSSPIAYVNFMPPELIMFGEDRMVAALQARPPDFVAIIDRPTEEYGIRHFGGDYGRELARWVASAYTPITEIAPATPGDRFGIQILQRTASLLR